MSEKLINAQLDRLTNLAEGAIERAAKARAELDQAMDLLTALGVAMTTKPAGEDLEPHFLTSRSASLIPRTLTLTERIMALDRRNPSVMFVGGGGGVGEASGGMGGDEPSACEEDGGMGASGGAINFDPTEGT